MRIWELQIRRIHLAMPQNCFECCSGGRAAHLGLGALREAGAEGAQDGGDVKAAAVLVLVDNDGRQQQDLAVAPLVVALQDVVRLRHTPGSSELFFGSHTFCSSHGLTDAERDGK